MPRPQEQDEAPAAAEVAAFLRSNPTWLAENPDLYRALTPPVRVHGERLADHMAAMLQAERAHAAAMVRQAEGVLAVTRVAAGLTGRVQRAVLGLLRATDPLDCIADEMAGVLGVDAVTLCVECPSATPIDGRLRPLPPGSVGRLTGGQMVVMRAAATDRALLHGAAAGLSERDVLVMVPGNGPIGGWGQPGWWSGPARPANDGSGPGRSSASSGPMALLALIARDERMLPPGPGATAPLAFLGQAVAAAFGRT